MSCPDLEVVREAERQIPLRSMPEIIAAPAEFIIAAKKPVTSWLELDRSRALCKPPSPEPIPGRAIEVAGDTDWSRPSATMPSPVLLEIRIASRH